MQWSPSEGEVGRWRRYGRSSRGGGGFEQNHGVAGVVYILQNDGFKEGFYKLGCSRRSGHARAFDLNSDANTGTPGSFKCIFQQDTLDCGRAEQFVFQRLHLFRRGKRGQEFFEVDLELARRTIISVCADVDATHVVASPPAPQPPPKVTAPPVTSPSRAQYVQPVSSPQEKKSSNAGTWIFGVVFLAFVVWVNQPKSRTDTHAPPPPAYTNSPAPAAPDSSPRVAAAVQRVPQAVYKAPPKAPTTDEPTALALIDQNAPPGEARNTYPQERRYTKEELQSIESVCSTAKYTQGPAAYRECQERQRATLVGTEAIELTGLSRDDLISINSACSTAKYVQGPLALDKCLRRNIEQLASAPQVNIASLTRDERTSIESACSTAKHVEGPASYKRCLDRQMQGMDGQERADLAGLNRGELQSAESACSTAKHTQGPAAYNKCLVLKVAELARVPPVDLTGLSRGDLQSLESVCSTDKYLRGPAAYRTCLARHLATLR
jgi:hypothetical protein